MTVNKFRAIYKANSYELTPELLAVIADGKFREKLYYFLNENLDNNYAHLILHLLKMEMDYREALWEGTQKDEDDLFENIYRCAFLVYRLGNPKDVFLLWEAKYINMDVGTTLDANYFIGAGFDKTIAYLEASKNDKAEEIAYYLSCAFEEEDKTQKRWIESIDIDFFLTISFMRFTIKMERIT